MSSRSQLSLSQVELTFEARGVNSAAPTQPPFIFSVCFTTLAIDFVIRHRAPGLIPQVPQVLGTWYLVQLVKSSDSTAAAFPCLNLFQCIASDSLTLNQRHWSEHLICQPGLLAGVSTDGKKQLAQGIGGKAEISIPSQFQFSSFLLGVFTQK